MDDESDHEASISIAKARIYQEEAFLRGRQGNTVMVGDTGVGKTYVAVMLCKHYVTSNPDKHCFFLAPTQQLVIQHAKSLKDLTAIPCGPYYGKELDYWNLETWKKHFAENTIFVMTPQVVVNLLTKGPEYLDMKDISLIVFDECHHARRRHPYTQIMKFYDMENLELMPRLFGMTASPTHDCTKVLRSKFYICKTEQTAGFAALAQVVAFPYTQAPLPQVVGEQILRLITVIKKCGVLNKESREKIVDERFLEMYQALGSWCALRYLKLTTEYYGKQFVPAYSDDVKQRTILSQLIQRLEDMLQKIESADKDSSTSNMVGGGSLAAGRTVSRLEQLVELLKPMKDDHSFRCLVFVERRSASRVVSEYLKTRIDLPVGFIVGQADSGSLIAYQAPKFVDTLHGFRTGEIQVLVTTNVSSEGIDVPQCNLVVALDPLKNPREFLHTRGRARHENGIFMYMVNANYPDDQMEFECLFRQAENIRRLDFSGDKKKAEYTLRSKYPRNVLKVESTGAELDMDSSTSVLTQFYQSLGYDLMPAYVFHPVTIPKCRGKQIWYPKTPAVEVEDEQDSERKASNCWYVCELSMPNFLGIPTITTTSFRKRSEAKCAAAYMACRELYKKDFINEFLFPRKEKGEGRVNLNDFEYFDKDLPRNISDVMIPRPTHEYLGIKSFLKEAAAMKDVDNPQVALYIYTYHHYSDECPGMKPLGIAYSCPLPSLVLQGLQVFSAHDVDLPPFPLDLKGPSKIQVPADKVDILMACHIRLCSIAIDRKRSKYIEKIDGVPEGFEDKGYMFVPVEAMDDGFQVCWSDVERYTQEPWETSTPMFPLPEQSTTRFDWLVEKTQGKDPYIFEVGGTSGFTTGDIKRKYDANRDKEGSEQWDHLMFEDPNTGQPYQVASGYTWLQFGSPEVPTDTPLLWCRRLPQKLAYDTVTCTLCGRRRRKRAVKVLNEESSDDDEDLGSDDEGDGKTKKVKKPKDSVYQEWLINECYFTPEELAERKAAQALEDNGEQKPNREEAKPLAPNPKGLIQIKSEPGELTQAVSVKVEDEGEAKSISKQKQKQKGDYKEETKKTLVKLQPIWKRKSVKEEGEVDDEEEHTSDVVAGNKREAEEMEELENDEEHERWKRARRVLLKNLIIPRFHSVLLYPASMLFSAMELMPIMYQIERKLQALELRKRIGDESIPLELVEESSTKPFYERLESLGDAYVGFVMAWYVFQLEPMIMDEGSLSDFRTNLVQNLRFLKCALREGNDLPRFIGNHKQVRNESFDYWDPSSNMNLAKKISVKEKVPADVVEAMIGAYLIGGGDVSAHCFLEWCGLPLVPNLYAIERTPILEGQFPISHLLRLRYSAFSKPAFVEFYGPDNDFPKFSKVHQLDTFEKKLGYKFTNKWLLLRAWTHPSFSHKYWPSVSGQPVKVYDYQRLEFLGDSVIGYLVVSHFFTKWQNCGPHDLTCVKALHVSNWKLAVIAKKDLELHKFMLYDSASTLQSIVNFDFNREDTTPKSLADSFEALIGAIFLDSKGDMELVHRVCWKWIEAAGRVGKERIETAKKFEEYKEGKDLLNIPTESLPADLLCELEFTEELCTG